MSYELKLCEKCDKVLAKDEGVKIVYEKRLVAKKLDYLCDRCFARLREWLSIKEE